MYAPKPFFQPQTLEQMSTLTKAVYSILPILFNRSADAAPVNVVPKIDPNAPKASMKIRLITGKAVNVEFNTNSKIADIYQYVSE